MKKLEEELKNLKEQLTLVLLICESLTTLSWWQQILSDMGLTLSPVGKGSSTTQLGMTRDIARNFNKTYNFDLFYRTEGHRDWVTPLRSPGIDGKKNEQELWQFYGLFDDWKDAQKRWIMSIVTDSLVSMILKILIPVMYSALINIFATWGATRSYPKNIWRGMGYGYSRTKLELLEILTEYLRPYQWKSRKNPQKIQNRRTKESNKRRQRWMNDSIKLWRKWVKLTGVK